MNAVDGRRFDHLARLLVTSAPRRSALAAMLASAIPAAVGPADDAFGARCLRNGQRCGRRSRTKGTSGVPCRSCCTGYAKRKRCACRGDGIGCNRPGQCCSGECVQGQCSGTCIALTDPCEPEADICCRSGAVCEESPNARRPVCCFPGGFPCDRPSDCCNGVCDHQTRRCLVPDPD